MEKYNFNEHIKKKLANIFGGSERKDTIILDDNNIYLLKLPDPTREKNRILSYINNSISEYIGCKVIKSIGLPVQEVILGEYTVKKKTGDKTYVACACKNIVPDGYALAEADKSSLGSEYNTKEAQLPSFSTLDMIAECVPEIKKDELTQFYSDLFVVDAFIGNPDRHNGNWGFLTGGKGELIAPIYDCGSSLCPLSTDEELGDYLISNDIANALSAVQDANGKRIKYKDYLYSCTNENVNEALKRIIPKIDITKVNAIIETTPYISEKRKEFYKALLYGRYAQVLLPALEQVFFKKVSAHDEIEVAALYQYYKDNLEELSNIEIGATKLVDIDGHEVFAKHVTNKYMLFVNAETFEAEALFSVRSSNRDVRKAMTELQAIYGKDATFRVKDDQNIIIPGDIKTSLDEKIAECKSCGNVSQGIKDKAPER